MQRRSRPPATIASSRVATRSTAAPWAAARWAASNTPWQWRTIWGKFQTDGFEDWKEWLLAQDYAIPENAVEIAQIEVQKIYTVAEWMTKPKAVGTRPKTSIMIEQGFY